MMCGDFRHNNRQFPDILDTHGAGIPVSVEPLALAKRALLWVVVLCLCDLLWGRVRALMMGMSRLGAGFATARHTGGAWWRGRRVGGRRFGGVLRMLIETGFELTQALSESGNTADDYEAAAASAETAASACS